MDILLLNFDLNDKNTNNYEDTCECVYDSECFCDIPCDCEYNCYSDNDCTQDTYR